MLASVPVAPVTELLIFRFAIAKDNRDDCLDFSRAMGPGGTADLAEIDGVELC